MEAIPSGHRYQTRRVLTGSGKGARVYETRGHRGKYQRVPREEEECPMPVTIELSPELERRLEQAAARSGQTLSEYVRLILERDLTAASGRVPKDEPPSAPDLLAGIRRRSAEELIALARQQGAKPAERFEDLLGDFWPEDESVDDFLEARRQWQWEGARGFPYDQPASSPHRKTKP
jgi:hypothetical protein